MHSVQLVEALRGGCINLLLYRPGQYVPTGTVLLCASLAPSETRDRQLTVLYY